MNTHGITRPISLKLIPVCVLGLAIAVTGFCGWAVAQDNGNLSKFLLIKLSREQSKVLCAAPEFTACMDFSEQLCLELSEKALQQCIVPLPDTISLQKLNSDVLEVCPQTVYSDAGYGEDKAAACLQKAFDQ